MSPTSGFTVQGLRFPQLLVLGLRRFRVQGLEFRIQEVRIDDSSIWSEIYSDLAYSEIPPKHSTCHNLQNVKRKEALMVLFNAPTLRTLDPQNPRR